MTRDKLNEMKQKIHWFVIPLFVSLITWMVVAIYEIKIQVSVTKAESEERKELLNKVYNKVEENFDMMQKKADEQSNEKDHQTIMHKMDRMESKIDKIYKRNNYTYQYVPSKDSSFLWTYNK